jgi:hypothetical protein
VYKWSEGLFATALDGYRRTLTWALDHPALMLLVFVATLALNVYLIMTAPTGFFPQQDTGVIMGGMQGPQDTSFYAMNKAVHASDLIISHDPGVAEAMAFTGGNGSTNSGFAFVAGRGDVPAGGAGYSDWGTQLERDVPVHAERGDDPGSAEVWAGTVEPAAQSSGIPGCEHGPAE